MALTKQDKHDIKEMLVENNNKLIKLMDFKLDELKEVLVTKVEFNELKDDVDKLSDDVTQINSKLDHDYMIRGKYIEKNRQDIVKIKTELNIE